MQRIRQLKLTIRLNLAVAATLVICVSAMGFFVTRAEVRQTVARNVDRATDLTETVAHEIEPYMSPRDIPGMGRALHKIKSQEKGLLVLRLINAKGRIAASTDQAEVGRKISPKGSECLACHQVEPPLDKIPDNHIEDIVDGVHGHRAIKVVTPIYNKAACSGAECHAKPSVVRVLGLLEADYDFSPVAASIRRRQAQTAALAAVLVVLVTGIIALFIQAFVQRPLAAVLAGMKRMGQGRLDQHIEVLGGDEIGEVAREFNTMAQRLQENENSLRRTRDYLLGIVENSSDIIITAGPFERIETFNRGAERILGYSRRDVVGRDWKFLFFDDKELESFRREVKSKRRVEGFEAHLKHSDGHSVCVLLTESHLWGTGGAIIGKILIAVDITEYKSVQKKLIQSERLAAIGTAVAQIYHSSKNILNAFRGGSYIVNTALKKDDATMLREGWEIIESAINRITAVTQDMMDFSRAGGLDLRPGSLNTLAQEVIWSLRDSAREYGITIVSQLCDTLPEIPFDAKVMHTALMNLVANAMDACRWKEYPAGQAPEIVVRTGVDESAGLAWLEVRDNGEGIPEESLDQIFAPFFSTKFSDGNGLGLPITKKAARDHGGTLRVQSEPGAGTAFTMNIPLTHRGVFPPAGGPRPTADSAT